MDDTALKLEGGLRFNRDYSKKPFFSIITIVYNDAKNIETTIKSVIYQKNKDYEYIIIDGGSKDGTLDVIKKYSIYLDYWVSEKDGGIYPAMNKGIILAKGLVVNMLNSGDSYKNSDVLSDVHENFKRKGVSYLAGRSIFIGSKGKIIKINNKLLTSSLKAGRFYGLHHQAFFYKKDLHKKFGLYSLTYKICSDAHFMYRVYYSEEKGCLLDKNLVVCNLDGVSNQLSSIIEYKKMFDEVFGRSIINELVLVKYHLKKSKIGNTMYSLYVRIKQFFKNLFNF
jgi:glycosyltransferase involved in cell wall biosynthesis